MSIFISDHSFTTTSSGTKLVPTPPPFFRPCTERAYSPASTPPLLTSIEGMGMVPTGSIFITRGIAHPSHCVHGSPQSRCLRWFTPIVVNFQTLSPKESRALTSFIGVLWPSTASTYASSSLRNSRTSVPYLLSWSSEGAFGSRYVSRYLLVFLINVTNDFTSLTTLTNLHQRLHSDSTRM